MLLLTGVCLFVYRQSVGGVAVAMPWLIEKHNQYDVVVVHMNSNKVNCINAAFIRDWSAALDVVQRDYSRCSLLICTAQADRKRSTWSSGLDFQETLRDEESYRRNVGDFHRVLVRLYAWPAPTVWILEDERTRQE